LAEARGADLEARALEIMIKFKKEGIEYRKARAEAKAKFEPTTCQCGREFHTFDRYDIHLNINEEWRLKVAPRDSKN
jgi:hypothetical protein